MAPRRRLGVMGSLSGTSLGDDTADSTWRDSVLSELQRASVVEDQRRQEEKRQRWIQIAVTASIPLFGVLWRAILGKRKRFRSY